ncbi:MAG TPA: bifunctional UDP-N-acetylglucosamine diphosphorylase/glucosamine-1-phosphate N-acetyltransferase GlmU [Solirubrobacterales bacterium]|nr:bifunctional UDP-N-acetylglucosamine diphosphorylase/glucosamine-1-phosphate N-acetyltransferase GlmU [Solirubrobacterales bacterium]
MTGAPVTALIMAAGQGTRMRSSLPKVLHPVCGRPMIAWPILAARQAGADRVAVIVSPDRNLGDALPDGVETIEQPESNGTGGAVRSALEIVRESPRVLVLSGDVPLISSDVITGLLASQDESGASATVMTAVLDDPGSYGRIVRGGDGTIRKIVEAKADGDATREELAIREINSGTYVFDGESLAWALGELSSDNAQGEYYLTDVIAVMRSRGELVTAHVSKDPAINLGVNNRSDLSVVEAEARQRILERHMLAGVTIVDPATTWIDAGVTIGQDSRIEPGTSLRGATELGESTVVGPHSTVIDSGIGDRSEVIHSYVNLCELGEGCSVGPFAYLRPGAKLADGARAGTFVEVKNSNVGAGSKIPHLSYVGDADIGDGSNLGAGTITANYDGREKHRTKIGSNVRIGVDTMLVAPVEVGDGAYTGAGAVIRESIPPGALSVSRNDQRNVDDYAGRLAARNEEGESSQ